MEIRDWVCKGGVKVLCETLQTTACSGIVRSWTPFFFQEDKKANTFLQRTTKDAQSDFGTTKCFLYPFSVES
jgi:hypothetical protein